MAEGKSDTHVEQPGPAEFQDPLIRREFLRAWVWIGSLLLVAAVILLSQPLLLIVGGLVFAVLLDGGTRCSAAISLFRAGYDWPSSPCSASASLAGCSGMPAPPSRPSLKHCA